MAALRDALTWMYPPLQPYRTGRLKVSDVHELHFEECGNPQGQPVVVVHGGPGAGCSPRQRQFFDPARYRVVLFDQRGCGKSTPHASLVDNTTPHLVADMELLRAHLGITRWQVFGGSWGSTLGLAYAQAHPDAVTHLILRGIFLGRQKEIDWVYQGGNLGSLFPEGWARFLEPVPSSQRGDLLRAYQGLLTSGDHASQLHAARAWNVWETLLSHLVASPQDLAEAEEEGDAIATARLEIHYFRGGCFLEKPLLDGVDRIRHIPSIIVQGRYDLVCPFENAWELHQRWPEADFQVIADAGHSAFEANTCRALVAATDRFSGPATG
jgi:proline iminopeptidase